MRFYIAGKYAKKEFLAVFAERVRATGHQVTSSWLNEPYAPGIQLSELAPETLVELAQTDLRELRDSHALIFFSERDTTLTTRNGRLVEFGVALGMGIPIIVVGPKENIFFHLSPQVTCYREAGDVLHFLPLYPSSPGGTLHGACSYHD